MAEGRSSNHRMEKLEELLRRKFTVIKAYIDGEEITEEIDGLVGSDGDYESHRFEHVPNYTDILPILNSIPEDLALLNGLDDDEKKLYNLYNQEYQRLSGEAEDTLRTSFGVRR